MIWQIKFDISEKSVVISRYFYQNRNTLKIHSPNSDNKYEKKNKI